MRSSAARSAFKGATRWLWARAHWAFPALASALTLSSTRLILGPVLNQSGDDSHHLLSEYAISHAVHAGDNPLGPVGLDFGQPILRFYQCLFYLLNVGIELLTGVELHTVHNATIVVCFALSPFAYLFFLRKLGLNRFAAAFGSLASMISVASFGNSIEAYHHTGIVTQSLGGLFFPLFMGCFIGMLRGENRPSTTALLFGITFLSHATMAVLAVLAGALYFLVTPVNLGRNWKRLAGFAVLGACLVSFWVFPFIAHTMELRAVPDSIVRGPPRAFWFNSVSRDELAMVLTTGRLLDDPPVVHARQTDPRDKLMDNISILPTLKTRPPVVTVLTGLGALFALFGLRMASRRFLLGGFLFALIFFTGSDDFAWLKLLPFIKQIQPFRSVYLVELFAFGLVGLGMEAVLRSIWNLIRGLPALARFPLAAVWLAGILAFVGWFGNENLGLGKVHLDIRNQRMLEEISDALTTLPEHGHPFRIHPTYRAHKIFQDWFGKSGYQPLGTHWIAVGPTAGFHLAWSLGNPRSNPYLYALTGIRYFSGNADTSRRLEGAVDSDGDPLLFRVANGKARRRRSNSWHHTWDFAWESFLRPLPGKHVPVVCNDAQWIWLARSWTNRFRGHTTSAKTPFPMRVPAGKLGESGLTAATPAVLYLDHAQIDSDRESLTKLASRGGTVVSPIPITGIETTPTKREQPWKVLPGGLGKPGSKKQPVFRDERNPVFDTAFVTARPGPRPSLQHFEYDVDLLRPTLVVLPMIAVPGWEAFLDGRAFPLYQTGPNLLGAYLPEGAHHLVLRWTMPAWHRIFLALTFFSLAAILFSWLPLRQLRVTRRWPRRA